MSALIKYDEACRAVAAALTIDDAKSLADKAEAMRVYARQANNRTLEIDAAQIRVRAERRLGEMLIAAKDAGQISRGQPPKNCADEEQFSRVTLEEAGIDRKLSSRAQKTAQLGEVRFEALMAMMREQALSGEGRVMIDVLRLHNDTHQRDHRRALARDLSEATAALPSGRKYPVIYADPPWRRKQGVTNRAYENHYPTMMWDEICALPVADMLLPDAWVFLWIPRAHLLALHPVPMEFADDNGCVITRMVKLPLAWAIARAWGCDAYSTCHVWTKVDDEAPDAQGLGKIWFDQNEILCLFKKGRGLPMPEAATKYGSNHSERPREHSRKPDFYREMIQVMTGGLPVLELFARVDAEHPLPAGWDAWGNQARPWPDALGPIDGVCCERDAPIVQAPDSCPHCIDSTDCATAPVCAAVADVYRESEPRQAASLASRLAEALGDIPEFLRRRKSPAPSEAP